MEIFLHKKDMPKNCFLCEFSRSIPNKLSYECIVLHTKTNAIFNTKRLSNCPLKTLNENELLPKYKKGDIVYRVTYVTKYDKKTDSCFREKDIVKNIIKSVYVGKTIISYMLDDKIRVEEAWLYSSHNEAQKVLDEWIGKKENADLQ